MMAVTIVALVCVYAVSVTTEFFAQREDNEDMVNGGLEPGFLFHLKRPTRSHSNEEESAAADDGFPVPEEEGEEAEKFPQLIDEALQVAWQKREESDDLNERELMLKKRRGWGKRMLREIL